MLNVLHPPSNCGLSAIPSFSRYRPTSSLAPNHRTPPPPPPPPSSSSSSTVNGSDFRARESGKSSHRTTGPMGYEAAARVGNGLSQYPSTGGNLPLSTGVIAEHVPRMTGKNSLMSLPTANTSFPLDDRPNSAAPAARYQPSSPVLAPEFEAIADESASDETANQIVSYLQIPSSINNSKGSLSDFAAQITCFFWFESSLTLHRVEDAPTTPTPLTPLIEEAKPCMGFRKWVTTMLSTTQVTQNVILLALLFIYRLKKQNPQVKGKPGSEYRLLTVALMLGNKFLDDNTYTNKTWADVSGIAVSEIHVMEVEFLSNMRYNLYTSSQEWKQWHRKLGRFWDYFNRASKSSFDSWSRPNVALPSPPQSQRSSPSFHTYDSGSQPMVGAPGYMTPAVHIPMPRLHEVDLRPTSRKRSYDEGLDEPAAKRLSRPVPPMSRPTRPRGLSDGPIPSFVPNQMTARLPTPAYTPVQYPPAPMYSSASIPNLVAPTTRAMTMVYGNGSQLGAQPHVVPAPFLEGPTLAQLQIPLIPHVPPPRAVQPTAARSATESPNVLGSGPGADLLSPASYAVSRSSPYRPVRTVNTLLVPPPPTSFQNPPLNLGAANMHYQPLGRPSSERRTGVVPYVHHDISQWATLSPFR